MIWLKDPLKFSALLLCVGLPLGCGVKGDPLPPEKPPELGRGRPTYKRAVENVKMEKIDPEDEESKESDDER